MSSSWLKRALIIMSIFSLDAEPRWPAVRATHGSKTFEIRSGNEDTPLLVEIPGRDGTALYKLECHNGSFDDLSFINFSGDFQCGLYSLKSGKRDSWNLLGSDDPMERKVDWNRARMTWNQLQGECAANPEYGRTRAFRLRGMRIHFEFKDLKWKPEADPTFPRLIGFTFKYDIAPDREATTPFAERARTKWPRGPCA